MGVAVGVVSGCGGSVVSGCCVWSVATYCWALW